MSNTESYLIVSGNDEIGSDVQAYAELIRDNIDLDILLERYPFDKELLNGIFDLILETVLCRNNEIVVASNKYPAELVRSCISFYENDSDQLDPLHNNTFNPNHQGCHSAFRF